MKKISLSMLAILFAASTVIAADKAPVKKAKTKQATCTSCKKTQQCTKSCAKTCDNKAACCK